MGNSRDYSHKVAIVGASETETVGVLPDRSMLQLHAESAMLALADAGLTIDDVDGVATAGPTPAQLTEYLNIIPRWVDGTSVGGGSFLMHVGHAVVPSRRATVMSCLSRTVNLAVPTSASVVEELVPPRSPASSKRRSASGVRPACSRFRSCGTCTSTEPLKSRWRRSPSPLASGLSSTRAQ